MVWCNSCRDDHPAGAMCTCVCGLECKLELRGQDLVQCCLRRGGGEGRSSHALSQQPRRCPRHGRLAAAQASANQPTAASTDWDPLEAPQPTISVRRLCALMTPCRRPSWQLVRCATGICRLHRQGCSLGLYRTRCLLPRAVGKRQRCLTHAPHPVLSDVHLRKRIPHCSSCKAGRPTPPTASRRPRRRGNTARLAWPVCYGHG